MSGPTCSYLSTRTRIGATVPGMRPLLLALLLFLLASPAGATSASGLVENYGLAGVGSDGASWSSAELDILEATLASLSPEEREAIRGVRFVRSGRSPRIRESGLFQWDGAGRTIFLYSRAFSNRGDAPNWTVVHEVGHAIAFAPFLKEQKTQQRTIEGYNAAVLRYNQRIKDYNAAATRFNRTRRPADRRVVEALLPKIEEAAETLQRLKRQALRAKRRLRVLKRAINSRHPRDGVLADYRRVLGPRKAPTAYGRSHIRESFADALAMYHCEPQRLKDVLPELYAWFAAGGHVVELYEDCCHDGRPNRGND